MLPLMLSPANCKPLFDFRVTTMQIAVEIPDAVLEATGWTPENIQAELRKELAVTLYRTGSISEGKAAELAGIGRFEFSRFLSERSVPRNYDADDLLHDLEWAGQKPTHSLKAKAAPLKQ
jgi:predicted HTH domain antitoxin